MNDLFRFDSTFVFRLFWDWFEQFHSILLCIFVEHCFAIQFGSAWPIVSFSDEVLLACPSSIRFQNFQSISYSGFLDWLEPFSFLWSQILFNNHLAFSFRQVCFNEYVQVRFHIYSTNISPLHFRSPFKFLRDSILTLFAFDAQNGRTFLFDFISVRFSMSITIDFPNYFRLYLPILFHFDFDRRIYFLLFLSDFCLLISF